MKKAKYWVDYSITTTGRVLGERALFEKADPLDASLQSINAVTEARDE